jgi:hypothetical protein
MLGLKYVFVMNFLLLCLSTSCIRSWAYTLKFACALNIQINSYPFEKALPSYVLILLNNCAHFVEQWNQFALNNHYLLHEFKPSTL